jgi:uncharacterized protein YegP (UPF0339 family)
MIKSVEVFKGSDGQYRWRLRADNGEILASSEAYSSRGKARKTAQKIYAAFKNEQKNGRDSIVYVDVGMEPVSSTS